jgi:hypothetical protein
MDPMGYAKLNQCDLNNAINHPCLGMVYTTYKNGDWGMVYDIVLPCFTHNHH